MNIAEKVKVDLRTDYNWNRFFRLAKKGARAAPSASANYALEKVPIVGWLPRYNYRWILNDVIAGLTIGLMLIPQGLSYAKIATIPVQYGLMSSWLPAAIYSVMGSTKDLSTGPTSLIGLLTSEIIESLDSEKWTPSEIASAVAMIMGIYGMILGFLRLGFLLEFISLPILSGFISAVAITIILNQMASLLGETNVGDGAANQIRDVFRQLPKANGLACAVGFTGILLLTILDHAGKRWGKKNKVIWLLSITRAFLTLVLYTGISYAVNKDRDANHYLFDVAKVKADGQEAPKIPSGELLGQVASRSIAVFIGAAVEHTAIARAFAVRNNYVSDQTQELCYFGVANFFNSFFHAMGVGGAMSRTAVNSSCNVKSPLSGLVTMAVVLISIYKLVGTLYWIPKATLAAIIITAVWPLISSPSVFYKYWKTSLSDFVSSMIAFWVSLFVSTEIGIGAAVGFNVVYILLRKVFTPITSTGSEPRSELAASMEESRGLPAVIPSDVRIFRLNESIFFPNAYSVKTAIMDNIQTHHSPTYNSVHAPEAERNWSVVGEKRVARLRKQAKIEDPDSLPSVRLVIIDFGRANHVDYTAVSHLRNLITEIKKYAGEGVEIRFVGMSDYVRRRFERAGWRIAHADEGLSDDDDKVTLLYTDISSAVNAPKRREATSMEEEIKKIDSVYPHGTTTHEEKV